MLWRATNLLLLLGLVPVAQATDVTIYGAGLRACGDYVRASDEGAVDLVSFTDWISGYLSGVNATSTHRNNFLGLDDLPAAMVTLHGYCQKHGAVRVAEAAWILVRGAKTGNAAHSVEVVAYGSGYKSCAVYQQAREQPGMDLNVDHTEFIAWLGGFLSGVNAISLTTGNVMGSLGLSGAVQWLDEYCQIHGQTAFGAAVQTLIDRSPDDSDAAHVADTGTHNVPVTGARQSGGSHASSDARRTGTDD
jgi:hypothetical protein